MIMLYRLSITTTTDPSIALNLLILGLPRKPQDL